MKKALVPTQVSIQISKDELMQRLEDFGLNNKKEGTYNLCDDCRAAVDALSTIEEVEAFNINFCYDHSDFGI